MDFDCNAFMDRYYTQNVPQEWNRTTSRWENDAELEEMTTFQGHAYCLFAVVGHTVGIVVKPLVYLGLAVVKLFFSIFCLPSDQDVYEHLGDALGFFINVFVSPVGQICQVAKAVAGIVYPGAYFVANDFGLAEA